MSVIEAQKLYLQFTDQIENTDRSPFLSAATHFHGMVTKPDFNNNIQYLSVANKRNTITIVIIIINTNNNNNNNSTSSISNSSNNNRSDNNNSYITNTILTDH